MSREESSMALPSWTGARHLAALRRHIVSGPGVPSLDTEGYASEILLETDVPEDEWNDWVPYVLHRMLRSERGRAEDDGRFVELSDGIRIRLGDCSWSERVEAAREALGIDEPRALDPIRVAEQVLAHVLDAVEGGPLTFDRISAPSLVQLAGALLDRYDRALTDEELEELDLAEPDDSAQQAHFVLALHRSLGRLRVPPHSPPRRDQPETRWPPRSRPPDPPLLVAPL